MRGIYLILFTVLVLGLMAWSAFSPRSGKAVDFRVEITAPAQMQLDSVELQVVEPGYGSLRSLGTRALDSVHGAAFTGQTDGPRVARLRFAGSDSVFFFILEPTLCTIAIAPTTVQVWGGELNHQYWQLVAQRRAAIERRKACWQRYASHLADSTLTPQLERELWMADSLQRERIQAATVRAINRPDVVGTLYSDRYFSTLDTLHARQVHPR